MKALFEIFSPFENQNTTLTCQVSENHLIIKISDKENRVQQGIGIYEIENIENYLSEFESFFQSHEWLAKPFHKIEIFFANREVVFVPFHLYDRSENENVLKLIHGDLDDRPGIIEVDMLTQQSVYAVYKVPKELYQLIKSTFPGGRFTHLFSCVVKREPPEQLLSVNFIGKKAIVALAHKNKWQFVREFDFDSVQDVLYQLLNICAQYELVDTPLEVGGLIERNSTLFMEIYKYFQQVTLAQLPDGLEYHEDILRYPVHYFSSYFHLTPCE